MQEIKEFKFKQIQNMGLSPKNLVGSGSMAEVFKGDSGGKAVAIKVYRKSKQNQWEAEKKLLTECRHPNIVELVGYGSSDDKFCLVMEFIEGATLKKAVEGK